MDRSLYAQCDTDRDVAYWERQALLQSIADALAMVNQPGPLPPHIAPMVAGSLTPTAPAKKPARILERYGIVYCQDCGLAVAYCCCDTRTTDSPSQDNREEANLNRRIRECRGR